MSLSLILGFLWVLACTVTAMLPMRLQYGPGITLLLAAPVLIIWIGIDHGPWVSAIATFALLSLFRNPLRFFIAKIRGQSPERPKEP